MLTHEKKAYFRRILEENLKILLEGGGNRGDLLDFFKDENADPLDRASVESTASMGFRFKERDRNLVWKIREALERLDDDVFGICDACGKEISEKRLEVRPIATLCIKCKENQEKYEKLYGT